MAEEEESVGALEMIRRLKEMKQLDLSSQELKELTSDMKRGLGYMDNVEMCSLAKNELEDLPTNFGKLKKLRFLQINNNHFVHLPRALGHLPTLTMLDARNNRLVDMDPNIIKKWKQMQKLMLRYNRITTIPREVKYLESLKFLSLRNNQIFRIPIELNELTNLEVLDCRNNCLKRLPVLSRLESLVELDMNHNSLVDIGDISKLKKLLRLSLGYNNLSFPGCLVHLNALIELDLEHNIIGEVPPELGNLKSLKTLYLSSNKLTTLPDELSGLKSLERLLLKDNELAHIPACVSKMKALLELDVRQNPLDFVKNKDQGAWARILKDFAWIPELRMDEEYNPNKGEYMQSLDRRSRAGTSGASRKTSMSYLVDMFSWGWGSGASSAAAAAAAEEVAPTRQKSTDLDDLRSMATALQRKAAADPNRAILREFTALTELNEKGLQRAKKDPIQNEDAHRETAPLLKKRKGKVLGDALFCVFDGHAGKECALRGVEIYPLELTAAMEAAEEERKADAKAGGSGKKGSLKKGKLPGAGQEPAFDDHSEALHLAMIATDKKLAEFQYEGCTATAVLLWKNDAGYRFVQAANVGDSTAYLFREGEPLCLTEDHKMANLYERERIQASGIFLNEGQTRVGGLGVTRALGDHFAKDTDTGLIGAPYVSDAIELLEVDSHIIVASDGLWDVMTPEQVYEVCSKGETAKDIAGKLMKTAVKNSNCKDNVTIQVIIL